MSVVINTNYAATIAANNLAGSSTLLQRSLNRLSSGSKIVNPADDAGGLAVAMKLSAAAHRQGATIGNISNTVSYLQTQDGALKTLGKILDRVSELKTLSTDPTKNSSDISNYNAEFTALQSQITAIGSEKFNSIDLFGNSSHTVATTEDGQTSVTLAAMGLLSAGGGVVTNLTLDTNPQNFTPTGAGTLTMTSGDLDFVGSLGTFLNPGESATFDGAGNWTQPSPRSVFSGSTVTLTTLNASNATATFTTSSVATNTGNVAAASGLTSLSLSTVTGAIADIATFRATNGADQSRLGFASDLLSVNKANLEAATSRITDVDVAEESTQLARYNILVQSGTAMLSQANQSAQIALKLLG